MTISDPSTVAMQSHFTPSPGYLSVCTSGLPSHATTTAMLRFVENWASGGLDARAFTEEAERCVSLFARIAGVSKDRVAMGSQVSQLVSVVATSIPNNTEVLCASGDFASITHPFEQLGTRGITVRYAPLSELAASVTERTSLVAFSLVQSATGEIADAQTIQAAASAVGARTCVDLTQSLGWLPIGAANFDFTVCHAYKWLCAPRGTAFLTVRAGLDDSLTPIAAGWYSSDDVWSSCYAGHTPLATGAGRFSVSPAWPALEGTAAALELFAELDPAIVHRHDVSLANSARSVLGLEENNSAIVTWADPAGHDLAAMQRAGIVASGRAGNARIAFHVWNTQDDIDLLARALGK